MGPLPARVLVDLPNWLGDFVHSLPALAALRAANRGGETAALLPAAHAPLASLLGVNVITRPTGVGFSWARRRLRHRFDVALTARHSTRAKLLLAGAGAPVRLASRGRGAAALGLTTFEVVRARHQRHDLDLALARLGLPGAAAAPFRLPLPDHLRRQGLRQRALLGDMPGMVALLPATRGVDAKRYPIDRFVAVAQALDAEGVALVVVVGPGEEHVAAPLVANARARVAPTAWALDEIAALLAACDAAVGNDSGLTHLAAAVGCPTVALFGPTAPARTAPVGGALVLRAPGSGAAVRDGFAGLGPAAVLGAVRAVLAPRAADGTGGCAEGRATV
ncbi:MAG: lipopolysaccharide heptosyltransferase family protein [Acidobacteria bacterium]|nr:MAG: lipopolysaccharide heptosyltransferase family protein [Acidobacteriota bacterium]